MRKLFTGSLFCATALSLWAQAPFGIHPRPSPKDYGVSQQTPLGTFAASVVPRDELKRIFAVDISTNYLVFEVAWYPGSSGSIQLSADDFLAKSGDSASTFTHPADAVTVAAVIEDKNTPRPPSSNTPTVVTTATVGYESATDPTTGRREHGVYTGVGTSVSNGSPDRFPPPGPTGYDRMTLQQQLEQRALPTGSFTTAVAGFLYFPAKEVKKKDGVYELDYSTGGNGAIRLQIPTKSH